MALLTSEQRDMCADVAKRWAALKAWYGNPANASKPAIKKIKQNEGLFAKIEKVAVCKSLDTQDVSAAGLLTPLFLPALVGLAFGSSDSTRPIDVVEALRDLEILEGFAIKDGYPKPANYAAKIDTDRVVGTPLMPVMQKVEDTVRQYPKVANITDPARAYPGGPYEPNKKAPESQYEDCKKAWPEAWCDYQYGPHKGELPWWVYALGATGAAGFGLLVYTAFKAAPYVMPIVAPQTAPFAQAWQQSRG